ncbi:MAG: hypothetical protein ACRC46_03205 [Thermoguttaceae bacterium]
MTNNIICMKWGTRYGAEYVNRLAAMVRRFTTLPHRFVCFTDDASGVDSRVEVRPLPPLELASNLPERGWRKLTVFQNKLADLEGHALFLDLDVVIRDSIDPFFKAEGEFLIIKDWDFPNSVVGNSSVFRFELGRHQDVLDRYVNDGDTVRREYRNEQAYLSHAIYAKGILRYWDAAWCVSFKRHCLRPFPLCYFAEPREPRDARIVIFHGHPNPDAAVRGCTLKMGFRHVKPTKWIEKYWNCDEK